MINGFHCPNRGRIARLRHRCETRFPIVDLASRMVGDALATRVLVTLDVLPQFIGRGLKGGNLETAEGHEEIMPGQAGDFGPLGL